MNQSSSAIDVQKKVETHHEDILKFMREICAIPSMNSQLKDVGTRIIEEMKKLGFDEARFDKMGNVIGKIG
ncbi:MAG: hypothetical protein ACYDH2_03355, partial [Anaerolineaceae bacterium]